MTEYLEDGMPKKEECITRNMKAVKDSHELDIDFLLGQQEDLM